MLSITIICVGRLRETHYIAAFEEYEKRLRPYCRFQLTELPEERLPPEPSPAEIAAGLAKEAQNIQKHIPAGAYTIAMCIEGRELSSEDFSALLQKCANTGRSHICFLVGSSFGLDAELKNRCEARLSMSKMTFPHHLARVMLAEQIYRGIMISEGSKYHK
ncbi:MAG: 23S rRNA (pseudouridine(1915)-N(3))-methyltransferase RlmH [Oscillospiraceae bacterium]|jgi:23S rRNA (pseudouridine1915-N3)-methyltransferase